MSNSDSSMLSMLPHELVLSCVRSDQTALSLVSKSHRSLVDSSSLRNHRKIKRQALMPNSDSSMLSMLPHELVLSCVRSDQTALSLVSKSHRSLVDSSALRNHRKIKRQALMPNSDSSMLSMLPHELVLSCVARVSRSDQAALSLVSKSHRSLVASPDLYRMRSLLGCAENCVYVCLLTPPEPIPRWFILGRGKSENRRVLSPIPWLHPCEAVEASSVVVLDWGIYVIGGLIKGKATSDVWLLDCRTHTWRRLPSMRLPRANAAAGVVDGKIYVLGGFLFFCHSKWGEVFDPKTQTWESLRREEDPHYIHDSMVRDEKIYAVDGKDSIFYYSPREGKWGRGNRGEPIGARHWCMVDNVLYCITAKGTIHWYEPEELDCRDDSERVMYSKEVKGLWSLNKSLPRSRLVHYDEQSTLMWDQAKIRFGRTEKLVDVLPGARLTNSGRHILLFWDNILEGDRLEIWCAEISLERRPQEGEIWGNIEWSNAVMTLDPLLDRYKLDSNVKEAFDVAYENIYAFHLAQKSTEKSVGNMKGVRCKRVSRSIGSVGLYVPGGTAVLPSTALMLAIPAQIAGCKTVVLATPPSKDGSICKEVLYCAKRAGVTHILKAGGAQAIAGSWDRWLKEKLLRRKRLDVRGGGIQTIGCFLLTLGSSVIIAVVWDKWKMVHGF